MRTELITIGRGNEALDGALHLPDRDPVRGAVLLFHGNVGNFYTGPSRFLPPTLTESGFACLAFNRRGHDILVNASGRGVGGGACQTAAEGVEDNERAAAFLADLGHGNPIVIGHSNGGMLAACFAAAHPETRALVLLSAHAGGADTYWRSCASGLMAADRAEELERTARELVAAGRGGELLLLPRWWYAVSAASLADRIDATPDLLEQAPQVTCPTLAIRGSEEPITTYPMEDFAAKAAGPAEAIVVEGSDHWYRGHEHEVTRLVQSSLARLPTR